MTHVALVTGGTRGIGAATARTLADAGYRVVATYATNDQTAREFTNRTGIAAYRWDASDHEACRKGIDRVERDIGAIDILVNNAGSVSARMFHRMSVEEWKHHIDVNLNSCFNMCRLVIAGMRDRTFGRIVNITSMIGQIGFSGHAHYAAAKAGIQGMTRVLANENASSGITVNAVAPGAIDTDMTISMPQHVRDGVLTQIPVGRFGRPADVARAVLFLVADDADFLTGLTLPVSGGQTMN